MRGAVIRTLFLVVLVGACLPAQQITPPFGGGGGSGAPNVTATAAGPVTSLAINVTSLNLTSISPALLQCWTGTGPFTPLAITNFSTTGTNPITTVTPTFTSSSNVTCVVNSNGGAGATGPQGPIGPTGATGPSGPINTIGVNGTSQAVQARANFIAGTNISITGTNNPGTGSTDVTISATGGGSGTVTSVGQTVPSWLTVAGSPVTGSGTLAITPAAAQTSHQVIGTCGTATSFGPCALAVGDLPTGYLYSNLSGTPTLEYQLLGNNGVSQTARNRLNLIPGTNITFSFADNPGTGSTDVTINSTGGGGGNVTASSLTTNTIPKATGATAIGDSSISDNGTTVSTTEPIAAPSVSLGTSPPAFTLGTGAFWGGNEGTCPTAGLPVAGVDGICMDSTSHELQASLNNGALAPLVQGPSSATTTGHLAVWGGTNGGTLTDGGPVPSGGGSGVGSQSSPLTFTALADGDCQDQTFTFTGITTSTQLTPGTPSTLPSGLYIGAMFASAANTVDVRLCNQSNAYYTGTLTYTAKIANYYLTGTGTPTWTSIFDGTCQDYTFTLTGASAGDPVVSGPPSTFASGLTLTMLASAANTIDARVCNQFGSTVTPSGTLTATIAK